MEISTLGRSEKTAARPKNCDDEEPPNGTISKGKVGAPKLAHLPTRAFRLLGQLALRGLIGFIIWQRRENACSKHVF